MDKAKGIHTKDSILKQITELYGLPVKALKERLLALFPESSAPSNKDFLIRRIAHKIQEDAFGGLSVPAQDQIQRLKVELDPLKNLGQKPARGDRSKSSRRLPLPGTIISKTYKGRFLQVKVLHKGFEYGGKPYRSLSRIAREITGVHQSGFVFFKA